MESYLQKLIVFYNVYPNSKVNYISDKLFKDNLIPNKFRRQLSSLAKKNGAFIIKIYNNMIGNGCIALRNRSMPSMGAYYPINFPFLQNIKANETLYIAKTRLGDYKLFTITLQ